MAIILVVLGIMYSFNGVLFAIGFLFKGKKFKDTDKKYNYAVLIAARNEEKVIGQLIDSIRKQDYPAEKITIFVVAHNCTDNTAAVAREQGAIVYELNNTPRKEHRKGYALKFALDNIKAAYASETQPNGIKNFDGYFIFDADNLIANNYITEMNKAFDMPKYDWFTSYLSEKNINTRPVPSYSSLNLYTVNMVNSRPMSLIGCAVKARGRGSLIRSELLKNGWKWLSLLEDGQSGAYFTARGHRSVFVESAELFDESTHTAKALFRQRMRWSKGAWYMFFTRFPMLVLGIIWPRRWRKDPDAAPTYKYTPTGKNAFTRGCKKVGFAILDGLQKRFSCYERATAYFPMGATGLIYGFLYPLGVALYTIISGDISGIKVAAILVGTYYGGLYLGDLLRALAIIVRESKRIRCSIPRLIGCIFIWPFFTIFTAYLHLYVLFVPVKWKPIPHIQDSQVEEMDRKTLASKFTEFVSGKQKT